MLEVLGRLSKWIGATALFVVMAIIFVSVIARYVFGYVIPDSYDLPRMFLGILIFWGIALAVAEGTMIKVDFLYEHLSKGGRHLLDIISAAVVFGVISLIGWRAGSAVVDAFGNGVSTSDMRLKLWPFYAVAAAAMAACVVLSAGLLWKTVTSSEQDTDEGEANQ